MKIHFLGLLLFLFIPLVLFLFLRFPFGVPISFAIAIGIIVAHRFVAIPFMNRYRSSRCLWCGRTSRRRESIEVSAGKPIVFEFCVNKCLSNARTFFDFCVRHRTLFRIGIFVPLVWYVLTTPFIAFGKLALPIQWNRFIFQFFIACTVVGISFLWKKGRETQVSVFPFPVHNLFLLGIRNTLLVFRYVGIWWIAMSARFLYHLVR